MVLVVWVAVVGEGAVIVLGGGGSGDCAAVVSIVIVVTDVETNRETVREVELTIVERGKKVDVLKRRRQIRRVFFCSVSQQREGGMRD